MSMVSEAMSSGRPVIVFMPDDHAKLKRKYQEFLNESERMGLIQRADSAHFEVLLNDALCNGHAGTTTGWPAKNEKILRDAARWLL